MTKPPLKPIRAQDASRLVQIIARIPGQSWTVMTSNEWRQVKGETNGFVKVDGVLYQLVRQKFGPNAWEVRLQKYTPPMLEPKKATAAV